MPISASLLSLGIAHLKISEGPAMFFYAAGVLVEEEYAKV